MSNSHKLGNRSSIWNAHRLHHLERQCLRDDTVEKGGRRFSNDKEFTNPDLIKYAESFGAIGHLPSSVVEFRKMLDIALNSKGVYIIDLGIDYTLNHELLNVRLANCAWRD